MIRRTAIVIAVLAATLLTAAPASAVGPGVITGTVSPASIAPEVEVCVVETRPSELCTAPEPGGSYRLTGVPVGPQRVEFVPSYRSGYLNQYFNHAKKLEEAATVVIPAPPNSEANGIDAELELGSTIEGTVTAAGGGPLPEVEVCAITAGTSVGLGCRETGPSGHYELHSLPAGSYRVGFWGRGSSAGYEPWYHPVIAVGAGTVVSGTDAALNKGARIGGTVRAAGDGTPLEGITVCLFGAAASTAQECTKSQGGGSYVFQGLPGGSYQVGFSLTGGELGGLEGAGEDGFETQYYDRVPRRAEAASISLIAPAVVGDVDAALFTPQLPAPPPPAAAVSSTAAAPPTIAEPKPKPKKKSCKKGYKRKKVKGKARCVKQAKRIHKKHSKHHQRGHRRGGGKQG